MQGGWERQSACNPHPDRASKMGFDPFIYFKRLLVASLPYGTQDSLQDKQNIIKVQ